MVRVANTGISAVIQSDGTITARTPLFKRGTETEHVYWRQAKTVYVQIGDIFAESCLALTLIALVIAIPHQSPGGEQQQREHSAVVSSDGRRN
jgi:apolipoprotein N-acyltransferase